MKKLIQNFEVAQRTDLNETIFVLELKAPKPLPEIHPGQFVNVLAETSKTTFLRRPISVYFVDYEKNTISLYIKKVGDGTSQLGKLKAGDFLNLVYPLGNSYKVPEKASNALLVGGGCGVAPLLYLAKHLKDKGNKVSILLGFRSQKELVGLDPYRKYGELFITTEDGSLGEKGFPTQHSILNKEAFSHVFTCGPEPMMQAVATYSVKRNINCEVSLENMMACGFGACLCCVTETIEGNKCTCTEGPVFNIKDLKWEI